MDTPQRQIALITGASSGFGVATARRLAAAGYDLILTARRGDRLESLSGELGSAHQVEILPLCFDVRDQEAVNRHLGELPGRWQRIRVLVNNAGLAAGRDLFDEALFSDWEAMIDTNLKGLLYVTRAVMPILKKTPQAQIINIGSIAGKQVYLRGNVYCATKHAVDAISRAMRMDLLPYAIRVTAIHPGAAETEFSMVRLKGDEAAAQEVYAGYQPLTAEDVADAILYCISLPPHVCVNDLVLTCTAQADAYYLHRKD